LKTKYLFFVIIVTLAQFLFSCTTDDECRTDKTVEVDIAFKQKSLNATTGVYSIVSLSIDSLWVQGLDNDSLIYNNKKSVTSISLPLKKFSQQTDYIFRFNDVTDTLTVLYTTNENYYLSLECGCIAIHNISEVVSTQHFIDSISIINPDVNNTTTTHIQIFN